MESTETISRAQSVKDSSVERAIAAMPLLSRLASTLRSPLQLAGGGDTVCPLIVGLEREFQSALIQYKDTLQEAIRKDTNVMNRAIEARQGGPYRVFGWTTVVMSAIGFGGLETGVVTSDGAVFPLLAVVGLGALAIGVLFGAIKREVDQTAIAREASAHRLSWLQNVEAKERTRVDKIVLLCERRLGELRHKCSEIQKVSEADRTRAEEACQLEAVLEAVQRIIGVPREQLTL